MATTRSAVGAHWFDRPADPSRPLWEITSDDLRIKPSLPPDARPVRAPSSARTSRIHHRQPPQMSKAPPPAPRKSDLSNLMFILPDGTPINIADRSIHPSLAQGAVKTKPAKRPASARRASHPDGGKAAPNFEAVPFSVWASQNYMWASGGVRPLPKKSAKPCPPPGTEPWVAAIGGIPEFSTSHRAAPRIVAKHRRGATTGGSGGGTAGERVSAARLAEAHMRTAEARHKQRVEEERYARQVAKAEREAAGKAKAAERGAAQAQRVAQARARVVEAQLAEQRQHQFYCVARGFSPCPHHLPTEAAAAKAVRLAIEAKVAAAEAAEAARVAQAELDEVQALRLDHGSKSGRAGGATAAEGGAGGASSVLLADMAAMAKAEAAAHTGAVVRSQLAKAEAEVAAEAARVAAEAADAAQAAATVAAEGHHRPPPFPPAPAAEPMAAACDEASAAARAPGDDAAAAAPPAGAPPAEAETAVVAVSARSPASAAASAPDAPSPLDGASAVEAAAAEEAAAESAPGAPVASPVPDAPSPGSGSFTSAPPSHSSREVPPSPPVAASREHSRRVSIDDTVRSAVSGAGGTSGRASSAMDSERQQEEEEDDGTGVGLNLRPPPSSARPEAHPHSKSAWEEEEEQVVVVGREEEGMEPARSVRASRRPSREERERPSSINARIREKAEARRRKEAEEINRRIRQAKERRAQAAATNEEAKRARALEEAEVINARVREKLDALGPRPSDGSVAATADYSDAAGSRDTAPQASPSPYSLPVKGRHAGPPRKGSPTAISRRPSATLPHRRRQVSP